MRNAYVRGGLPRARAVEAGLAVELHGSLAHEVITAELVACTLGARRRPELLRPEPLAPVVKRISDAVDAMCLALQAFGQRVAGLDLERQAELHRRAAEVGVDGIEPPTTPL